MKKLDFLNEDHCIVSTHRGKQKQPILTKYLGPRVFKKLNSAMLYNILLKDNSPYEFFPIHWNHAIHPPTFKLI